jgi:hypothetical protein
VLKIWRVQCRSISYLGSGRAAFVFFIALKSDSEANAIRFIRKETCSPEWWDSVLLLGVECLGELRFADGIALPMEED